MFNNIPKLAVQSLKPLFKKTPTINCVILFGSRAIGREKPSSDIDLCIDAPDMTYQDLTQLDNLIDNLLLPWKIDLILKHTINNQALLDHINHVGIVFYTKKNP